MEQQVMWTVLPTGVSANGSMLKFSVFVSPRLTSDPGDENLSAFPDFLDWPSFVSGLQFSLVFDGGPTINATVTSVPSSSIWKLLFNSETYVKPYAYNSFGSRLIRSFPSSHVATFLQSQYLTVATTNPPFFPTLQTLGQIFQPITWVGSDGYQRQQGLVARINGLLKEYNCVPSGASDTPTDFLQVMLFHQSHNAPNPAPQSAQSPFVRVAITVPPLDFHDIVSTLGKYPLLMRQLGLVLDMEVQVPVALTHPIFPISTTVSVASKGWTRPTNISAKTECTADPAHAVFAATPDLTSNIANGMLQLSNAGVFNVFQFDLDSAAMKALSYASSVARMTQMSTFGTPVLASLPALRSGGVTITQTDRALTLTGHFQEIDIQNSNANSSSTDAVLYADDITRGYSFDVWNSQTSAWNSLHLRAGTYDFLDSAGNTLQTQQVSDEGWLQLAATQAADGSSTDLYVHESILKWTGWSLSAPRYGKGISNQDAPERYDSATALSAANSQLASASQPPLPNLATSFTAQPGTLPLLRFGTQYRIRARAVDLAGNSVTPSPTDFSSATALFTYSRFDPVPGPIVVLREELNPPPPSNGSNSQESPGESLRFMVIRSNFEQGATAYNAALSASTGENYLTYTERIIAPPRASQQMAELHGMFDMVTSSVVTGMYGDQTTYQNIAMRDSWNFQVYADDAQRTFPLYPNDDQAVNYIPDPLSRGAMLTFTDKNLLPIGRLPPMLISFYPNGSTWPNATTFKLRLVPATNLGPDSFNFQHSFDGKVLQITVPQGQVVNVTVSSFLDASDLAVLGVWNWISQVSPPPANLQLLSELAVNGELWMLTPFSELTLVHAVQQPLIIPDMSNPIIPAQTIAPMRELGWTYVNLVGSVPVDGTTTVKVDLLATWQEPVDPLNEPSWSTINGTAHPFELQVTEDEIFAVFGPIPQPGLATPGIPQRHEFGDTKYRHVVYTTVATTRFMEEFPTSVTQDPANVTQTSPAYPLDILSTARPAAPKVLYVVPAFQWNRTNISDNVMAPSAQTASSVRGGGLLRVYMDRPWWSSGDGELLGVLLWEYSSAPPAMMFPYISMIGNDPIWSSGFTPQFPTTVIFPLTVAAATNLTLEEEAGDDVSVAGHNVTYDPGRRLWYCDIQVDRGAAYNPFIRLALARYQPHSLGGVELSRVVLADFMQLSPDRSASIVFNASNPMEVNVSVSGVFPQTPANASSESTTAPNSVFVNVEQKIDGIIDPNMGWILSANPASSLHLSMTSGSPETWSGTVTLPAARGSQPMRLVISEYENYTAEGGSGQRLVYAEAVQL